MAAGHGGLEARRSHEFVATTERITEIFLARGVLHDEPRPDAAAASN